MGKRFDVSIDGGELGGLESEAARRVIEAQRGLSPTEIFVGHLDTEFRPSWFERLIGAAQTMYHSGVSVAAAVDGTYSVFFVDGEYSEWRIREAFTLEAAIDLVATYLETGCRPERDDYEHVR